VPHREKWKTKNFCYCSGYWSKCRASTNVLNLFIFGWDLWLNTYTHADKDEAVTLSASVTVSI